MKLEPKAIPTSVNIQVNQLVGRLALTAVTPTIDTIIA